MNKILGVWLKTLDSCMQFYLKIITFLLGCIILRNSVKIISKNLFILGIKILFFWKQLPFLKPSQDLWKKVNLSWPYVCNNNQQNTYRVTCKLLFMNLNLLTASSSSSGWSSAVLGNKLCNVPSGDTQKRPSQKTQHFSNSIPFPCLDRTLWQIQSDS